MNTMTNTEWEEITEDMMNMNNDEYEYCEIIEEGKNTKEKAFDTVKAFMDAGVKQVNIHQLLSKETYDNCLQIIDDMQNDKRLKGLNAIVFLMLKKKGKGTNMNYPSKLQYKKLVEKALKEEIRFGMDSCSAPFFFEVIKDTENFKLMRDIIEPCESGLFSSYINWEGKFFPCSFCEEIGEWKEGLDVINCNDFTQDIWNHPLTLKFRDKSINSTSKCDCKAKGLCRTCNVYEALNKCYGN